MGDLPACLVGLIVGDNGFSFIFQLVGRGID